MKNVYKKGKVIYMMKAVERIRMANMPFDKFENNQFIHATGYMVELEDGSIEIEYEGEEYVDSPECKYSEEEEEEEEDYRCIYENDEMTVEA